jgi:hypothetical protein
VLSHTLLAHYRSIAPYSTFRLVLIRLACVLQPLPHPHRREPPH